MLDAKTLAWAEALDPAHIAQTSSPRHVQSVIEGLVSVVCRRSAEIERLAQPVKRLTDEQIREVLLSASRDAAVKLGVPADELGEPDEDSLHSATMVARWVEPAMAAAWGMKLED